MNERDIEVTVYSKTFQKRGTIGAPSKLTAIPRHNVMPTAQLVVPYDHPRVPDLLESGSRVVIRYRGEHLIGGPVRLTSGEGPTVTASLTFTVEDDYRLLSRILAWPKPAAAIGAQDVEYRTVTGPAEAVVKTVVGENAARLGLPLTVAPNQNRGATITQTFRFHTITDRLMPLVDAAGIGVTVQQVGSGLVLDCYARRTYPRTLTEASRIVQDWSWNKAAPTATRLVVGGAGEGVGRIMSARVAAAREAEWGDVVEDFVDATDLTTTADLNVKGDTELALADAKAGLSVSLSETEAFRYNPAGGSGVRVGDLITMQFGPGITITDVLREATLTWDEGGVQVTPSLGESQTVEKQLLRGLSGLARALRIRNAGR